MSKVKTAYFCQNCGAQSPKWLGKCTSCGQWNTYVEEVVVTGKADPTGFMGKIPTEPQRIGEIVFQEELRTKTPDAELNRVLGGGIVPGSVVLIGGEPGIGKSTLLLQAALGIQNKRILYVSGEESESQIKMRAERLDIEALYDIKPNEDCYILSETATQNIFAFIDRLRPELLIVDSVQTLASAHIDSAPGSVSQVRECTAELLKYSKQSNTPVFLIGHITKEGTLAGPKVLEHMVDTVMQFEGDRHLAYRILRTVKNRFGSASELGIYEMLSHGLREVKNPSEILISQRDEPLSGITVGVSLEGNRPLLIEIQALVSNATYGTPQRSGTGFDSKRLNMLLAVLEKRGGFRLSSRDVFLNVAGGIRTDDPAVDLAVCMAVLSSHEDIAVPKEVCFAAEVGLGGEVRAVNRIESRISEAEKLGFKEIYISKYNSKSLNKKIFDIQICDFSNLGEVISALFG